MINGLLYASQWNTSEYKELGHPYSTTHVSKKTHSIIFSISILKYRGKTLTTGKFKNIVCLKAHVVDSYLKTS